MKHVMQSLSFGDLALRYKTVSRKQLDYATSLLQQRKKHEPGTTIEQILMEKGFATKEQIDILNLILDFLKLQETSRKFGEIAVKLGYAKESEVRDALEKQHKEFKLSKIKKKIGDILVESKIITVSQKNTVIKEQQKISKHKNSNKKYLNKLPLKNSTKQKQFNTDITDMPGKPERPENARNTDISPGSAPLPLEVIFSKDFTEIWIKVKENSNAEKISLDQIKNAMIRKGMKFSLYTDALLQATIDTQKKIFMAAIGKLPSPKPDMVVKYHFDINRHKAAPVLSGNLHAAKRDKPALPGKGPKPDIKAGQTTSSDFGNNEIKVKKGTVVAELDMEAEHHTGKNYYHGKDVLGRQIGNDFYGNNTPAAFSCGKGAVISHDKTKVIANRSGIPVLSIEKKIYVLSITNVFEDADLKFGRIEDFSNINVAGILTGAFPVTAGRINTKEIRETRLKALLDITVKIGITNAFIRTQGNVYAKYIHNSTVLAFGDVVVEHEIIDSTVIISGKCKVVNSKIIASKIYAKQGIVCAGAGSDLTTACTLMAGGETHIIHETGRIHKKTEALKREITKLKKNRHSLEKQITGLFKKMTGLKLFYDRVKKERNIIDISGQKSPATNNKSHDNTIKLRKNLDEKMESIIKSIKKLNQKKQTLEVQKNSVEKEIKSMEPKINQQIWEHKRSIENIFQWAKKRKGAPEIIVKGKIAQGTVIKGIYSSITIKKEYRNIKAIEVYDSECDDQCRHKIIIKKLNT